MMNDKEAYIISNEDLRWIATRFPDARRVLTVAASGDQALFHTLAGATHVDTFDITPYAQVIQDIKTTAIGLMGYDKYCAMLERLPRTPLHYITDIDGMNDVIQNMPMDSWRTIVDADRNGRNKIFGRNSIDNKNYRDIIINPAEYTRLTEMRPAPFKFIQSDVMQLHTHLTGEYDLINLSNIFDFLSTTDQRTTLGNLAPHVKPGGAIIHMQQNHNRDFRDMRADSAAAAIQYTRTIQDNPNDKWAQIIVFQRTR